MKYSFCVPNYSIILIDNFISIQITHFTIYPIILGTIFCCQDCKSKVDAEYGFQSFFANFSVLKKKILKGALKKTRKFHLIFNSLDILASVYGWSF